MRIEDELLTGLGAQLFTRLFGGPIRSAIATENDGLKRAAERVPVA